jgi:transposase
MRGQRHTKEFRDSTVQLVLNNGEKLSKIADDLDINIKTLYHWIRMYKKEHNLKVEASSSSTLKETAEEELKRLRKENKLLKQERDILKKATAYFA